MSFLGKAVLSDAAGNLVTVTNNKLDVNAAVTFPSTLAVTQSGTWNVGITGNLPLPTGASTSALQTSGNTTLTSIYNALLSTLSVAVANTSLPVTQSGGWNVGITGTVPLPTGAATAALQPAINGDGGSLAHITNFPATQAVTQSGSWTVTANAGTNLNTSLLALETGGNLATIATSVLAQASTTSGQKGHLGLGAVTTAAPSYTTAQTSALSLTTAGGLRTDLSSYGGTATTLGQKAASASIPVTLASDNGITQAAVSPNTTTAPSAIIVMAGKSQDGTPNYNAIPLVAGSTAVATSGRAVAAGGATPYFNATLSNTAATVKSSAGSLYGFTAYNPSAAIAYLQFLDATSPTVGTTAPVLSYPVPAGGWYDFSFAAEGKVAFANAIKIAATTTAAGATAPGTALVINAQYA